MTVRDLLSGLFTRPRAGVRRACRRAVRRLRGSSNLVGGAVIAFLLLPVFLYAAEAGLSAGIRSGVVFVGLYLLLGVGAPLALAYAWPLLPALFVGGLLWGTLALGAGFLWLGLAAASLGTAVYLFGDILVPLGLLGALAVWLWGKSVFLAVVGVAAGLAWTAFGRRYVPVHAAGAAWSLVAALLASDVAVRALGAEVPVGWAARTFQGPVGLGPWVAAATVLAAAIVGPSGRELAREASPPEEWRASRESEGNGRSAHEPEKEPPALVEEGAAEQDRAQDV